MKSFKLVLIILSISMIALSCKKDDQEEIIECLSPESLIAEVGINEVDFSWTNLNSTTTQDWSIQYGEKDFSLGTGVIVNNITNTFFTLNDLDADTEYCYYVKANCDNENSSSWQGPKCFTTLFEGASFVVKVDGVELNNNDSRTYTGIGEYGNMDLRITNKKNAAINLVIEVISITGTDGSATELCLGNCYSSIMEGAKYPLNSSYELDAGITTAAGVAHIVNQDDRSGDLEFVFELYEVDSNNEKLTTGTSLRFLYKYDAP